MASSKVQMKCEKWIVNNWLKAKFKQSFSKKKLTMQGRGVFEFDAVSEDDSIIANISTATAQTHNGKAASGKKSKLRADCLMLNLAKANTKLLILTEACLFKLAIVEQEEGRLPLNIKIFHSDLPQDLKIELIEARNIASNEVRKNY